MGVWAVTVDMETYEALDERTLVDMGEHAEDLDGSVSSRGLDGPGFTLRVEVDAPGMTEAVGYGLEAAAKLAAQAGIHAVPVSALAETPELADLHAMQPDTPELLAATDVAEVLGVSRQRVHQLTARPDFPAAYVRLGSGPVWTRPAIEHFDRIWDRKPGRPARAS